MHLSNLNEFPHANSTQLRLIEKACCWMTKDLSKPIRISEICQAVGVSRSKLSILFRIHCGCGVKYWLIKYKIKKSVDLLINSEKTINEIAYDLGFYDSPCFCKTFKSHQGISPRKYRITHKK